MYLTKVSSSNWLNESLPYSHTDRIFSTLWVYYLTSKIIKYFSLGALHFLKQWFQFYDWVESSVSFEEFFQNELARFNFVFRETDDARTLITGRVNSQQDETMLRFLLVMWVLPTISIACDSRRGPSCTEIWVIMIHHFWEYDRITWDPNWVWTEILVL